MKIKHLTFVFLTGILLFSVADLSAAIEVKNRDRIAFLGDNVTAKGNLEAGYISYVISALKDHGIHATKIPAGVAGNKASDMLARLQKDVLRHKPQILILNCGMNDATLGKRNQLEKFKKNVTGIVEKAQAAKVKVYILTATMISENINHSSNRKLKPYNDFLRKLAKEKNCVLIDLYNEMIQTQNKIKKVYPGIRGNILTIDGIHMNPLGDIMIANCILKALGMTEEQLAKSYPTWIHRRYIIGDYAINLSVWDFLKLSERAFAARTDVPNLVRQLVNRKLKEK